MCPVIKSKSHANIAVTFTGEIFNNIIHNKNLKKKAFADFIGFYVTVKALLLNIGCFHCKHYCITNFHIKLRSSLCAINYEASMVNGIGADTVWCL